MLLLGIVWLVLLVLELTGGETHALIVAGTVVWGIFILEFGIRFALAPAKGRFLRKNWLTLLSLVVPALRILRILRLARLLRSARMIGGLRLLRIVAGANRGLRALRVSLRHHGFGYVLLFITLVIVVGAAGMFAFERNQSPGLQSYPAALWWTAMMMTTVGSDYFPRSSEGRLLCLMIATMAFALWGYFTATLASFLLGDARRPGSKLDR